MIVVVSHAYINMIIMEQLEILKKLVHILKTISIIIII